jgi:uncharacterized protein YfaS (alpha-2-macroglobulin family)
LEHPSIRGFFRAFLFVLLAVAGMGQAGESAFFSLTSARTFAPGEKPSVQLSAYGLNQVGFRVYRVNDPVKFFSSLEDAHMFGGSARVPPHEETAIERFHDWKRGWRAWMRDTVRRQFSAPARASIHERLALRRRSNVTNLADAPLLNSQQVVAKWTQSVVSGGRWDMQTVPLEIKGKGVYLVEAVHGALRAYTIVMITDLAMITKSAPGRAVAYLVNRQSGNPVADAGVTLWEAKQQPRLLQSGAQGLVDVSLQAGRDSDFRLMARSGDDFAVNTLSGWSIGADASRNLTGFIYTDRPVYRPGHTVQFKALLRQREIKGYSIPPMTSVDVEIEAPDQKKVYRKTLPLSRNGTAHDSWVVPANAALGYYSVQIRVNEAFLSGGFEIQEYKKPDYEVKVSAAKARVLQGETIQATIDARYYFGEPVKNAKVTYAVYRSAYWSPILYADRDEDFDSGGAPDEDGNGPVGGQESEQTGTLDADGKLVVTIPTTLSKDKTDAIYRVEARVTDEGNREISGTGYIIATYGSFAVDVEPDRYVYAPGDRAVFTITARNYDNQAVRTAVKADLEEWRWDGKAKSVVKASASAQTDPQGAAKIEFQIPSGGSFRVRVSASTPEGRVVEGSTYLWVSGGDAALYGEKRQTLQLIPDKKSYRSGDTARILIVTGVPKAQVLFSVEGSRLQSARVVAANGPSVEVEVPIERGTAPGFFASAAFIYRGDLYQGNKRIKVPPVEETLHVALTPSKPQFQPGEKARYSLDVTDHAGQPVAAEFSLGVVDEAIYAIRKDTTPDLVQFFYGNSYDAVATDSSLNYYFHGEAGHRRMRLAEFHRRAPLAQIKPERLVQPKVRKIFPDTAFWDPDVVTDARGHAQAQFAFPDSLTTWRATARGITSDTKVGTATVKTIVRKNVMLRLVAPRFFTAGDEVTISEVIHNYLPNDKQAQVSLDMKGLDVVDGAARQVNLPSKGDTKVDWRVKAGSGAEAVLTGKALTDEESDAMEITLPIHPRGVQLSDSRGGSLSSSEVKVNLNVPESSDAASRTIDIDLSPSIAGSLFGALQYLTSFPYGCTEQTMSSFLPNVIVAQTLKELKLTSRVDPVDLEKKVTAGLERLYDYQHEDGGWGWWKTDESAMFMTAYVVSGLAQARSAGYEIRADVLQRATQWLVAQGKLNTRLVPDLKAWNLYSLALAGTAESQMVEDVYARRADLSPYGLALLGLALDTEKDGRAKQIGQLLAGKAQQDDTEAHWAQDRDWLMDFYWDVSPEATAYAVKLLSRTDAQNPLLPKAALWLMNHRNEGYYWSSTKQTAMVIYGLADYLKITGELKPAFTATVFVNGKQALRKTFSPEDATSTGSAPLHFSGNAVKSGQNEVRIDMKGAGRLYWSARADYYSTGQKVMRTGSAKLNILRDYFKLTPSQKDGRIIYDLNPVNGALAVGDILAVRLTVTGDEWRYLMVEDPIPAGCEFIERDNLYELASKPDWWTYWFTRRELHDNRMAIFQTYFGRGQQQYFYLLKVVNPGKFEVNPARVQPMYQPKYLSTTESFNVEVK